MFDFIARWKNKAFFFLLLIGLLVVVTNWKSEIPLKERSITRKSQVIWGSLRGSMDRIIDFPGKTIQEIKEFRTWRKERELLLRELATARLETARQQTLLRELDRLKELLKIKPSFQRKVQVAEITAYDPTTWRRSFTIRMGDKEGLVLQSPVLAQNGVVGRIIEVGEDQSVVLLVLDPQSSIAALDLRSGVRGIVKGTGSGNLKYLYVSVHADVQEGDLIVTSGEGGVFSKGYPIGTVRKVKRPKGSFTLDVDLEPVVDFGTLDYVFVEKLGIYER